MMVQVVKIGVTPTADCVAPPATSKIMKYCFGEAIPRKISSSIVNVSISMLFEGRRALYSTEGKKSPVVLKAGKTYSGRVTIVDSSTEFIERVNKLGLDSFVCDSVYGVFHISISEIEVTPLEKVDMELPKVFKVVFNTPTILNSKLMSPPPLADKVAATHKLIPQPSFIFSHLLRFWNTYAPPEHKLGKPSEWAPYLLGRMADISLVELDYRVRAVTAIVGKDDRGRLRKSRGFVGWVIYESKANKKLHSIVSKLLALASLVGVGRSRGIGFGHVSIEIPSKPVEERESPSENRADAVARKL
ncbi:MAG: CRISPR system precrRNA processing endoribonuclease RAMP protein Cas6 [Sulfolobales archaeon]|nr:CRISPR system precrRNA processing endoribonuclease RAMP protein Cas6 [Sulfolobales archaeon]MDW8082544.1 CRISPR system precrRNA processing endoribonuclease RAMP protein Cas6 [Sulfolobales archaeon]